MCSRDPKPGHRCAICCFPFCGMVHINQMRRSLRTHPAGGQAGKTLEITHPSTAGRSLDPMVPRLLHQPPLRRGRTELGGQAPRRPLPTGRLRKPDHLRDQEVALGIVALFTPGHFRGGQVRGDGCASANGHRRLGWGLLSEHWASRIRTAAQPRRFHPPSPQGTFGSIWRHF